MSYYGRKFEVLLNNSVFIRESKENERQFRVVFSSLIDYGGFNSYLDIKFYNLSESTRTKAFKRSVNITLRAGYHDTIDTIFHGKIVNVFVQREESSIITNVIARGGTINSKSINQTFAKNTKITDIIRACVKDMGYPIVIDDSQFKDFKLFSHGYTLTGSPVNALSNLAKNTGFSYVRDGDRIIVVPNGKYRSGNIIKISRFTGMEGIPQVGAINNNKSVLIDVNVRLNPKIRIGGRIEVESEYATFTMANVYYQNVPQHAGNGVYTVNRINHQGDSWGDSWTSKVKGLRNLTNE